MCIICVSKPGARQPNRSEIVTMFSRNPDGAGYMYARDGVVHIHKGYMNLEEFINAIEAEHFTADDSVVYHFRISTQAGVTPAMTHPFPLTNRRRPLTALDVDCSCGVAHNGIIYLTSDPSNHKYSDTALFINKYLSRLIRCPYDLQAQGLLDDIYRMTYSKFAIMDGSGYIATIGEFINERGLLFSNASYSPHSKRLGGGKW